MSKRQKTLSEVHADPEMDSQTVRVTRSGRISRPPTARAEVETPKRNTRRTRKSAVQELTEAEEKITEQTPDGSLEREPDVSARADPCPVSEPGSEITADLNGTGASVPGGAAPAETAPTGVEFAPKKKPLLAPSGTQKTVIPLGKPKSGRVWKDRNKKRSGIYRGCCYCHTCKDECELQRKNLFLLSLDQQIIPQKSQTWPEKQEFYICLIKINQASIH